MFLKHRGFLEEGVPVVREVVPDSVGKRRLSEVEFLTDGFLEFVPHRLVAWAIRVVLHPVPVVPLIPDHLQYGHNDLAQPFFSVA